MGLIWLYVYSILYLNQFHRFQYPWPLCAVNNPPGIFVHRSLCCSFVFWVDLSLSLEHICMDICKCRIYSILEFFNIPFSSKDLVLLGSSSASSRSSLGYPLDCPLNRCRKVYVQPSVLLAYFLKFVLIRPFCSIPKFLSRKKSLPLFTKKTKFFSDEFR